MDAINKELPEGHDRGAQSRLATLLGVERGTISKWKKKDLKGERVIFEDIVHYMRMLGIDPVPFFAPGLGIDAASADPNLTEKLASLKRENDLLRKLNAEYEDRIKRLDPGQDQKKELPGCCKAYGQEPVQLGDDGARDEG